MAAKKKDIWTWLIFGIILFVALVALIVALRDRRVRSRSALLTAPQPGEVRLINGVEMVHIPAGKFILGSSEEEIERAFHDCQERIGDACQRRWFEAESPRRTVDLEAFWIDRTEVTNAQYQRFLEANPEHPAPYLDAGWATPYNWDQVKRTYPEGRANHPVVMVTWYDANAYCRGRQARLPTEAEWEKAARGTDGLTYPWGDEFDKDRCNIADSGIKDTTPVGKYSPQGDSPYGLADMAGNVWECVADNYQGMTTRKVLRGGSWTSSPVSARAARRFYFEPVNRNDNIGFRCARSEAED
jgi:formylglycine-generating enzyme required for sulfatase activity